MSDTFEFDHLPLNQLTRDQHIASATAFFQKMLRLYPNADLELQKQLRFLELQACGFSQEECQHMIQIAAKKAIEKQSI